MPDYGKSLEFGYFLTPTASDPSEALRLAALADELGLDLLGVQDHPYQGGFLDTWTLLSAIAARTERIRVFPDVANLPLRPPAVLAKAAATLDLISGGRVEMGLGAGGFWDAIEAMGGPRRGPGEAVAALEEAIRVIRLMWGGGGAARFSGDHYRLGGVRPGPAPAHPVGIWVGAYGPRMLELTGRLGDGWIPSHPYALPEHLPQMNRRIDNAATEAGRDPSSIRRLYNVGGVITRGGGSGFLEGPPSLWTEQLVALALEGGIDGFLFVPSGDPDEQLRRFAEEAAPAVREAVAKERARCGVAHTPGDPPKSDQ